MSSTASFALPPAIFTGSSPCPPPRLVLLRDGDKVRFATRLQTPKKEAECHGPGCAAQGSTGTVLFFPLTVSEASAVCAIFLPGLLLPQSRSVAGAALFQRSNFSRIAGIPLSKLGDSDCVWRGGAEMLSGNEYRQRANECIAAADRVAEPERKVGLLELAQRWLRLAVQVDQIQDPDGFRGDALLGPPDAKQRTH